MEMEIKDINKIIGKNIKKIRKSKGITQKDLAKFLNKTQQSIANYEKGLYRIDYNKAKDLAILLAVSILHFFNDDYFKNIDIDNLYKTISYYFDKPESDIRESVKFTEFSKKDIKESVLLQYFPSKTTNNQNLFYQDIKKLADIYICGDEKLISIINNQIDLIFNMISKKNS